MKHALLLLCAVLIPGGTACSPAAGAPESHDGGSLDGGTVDPAPGAGVSGEKSDAEITLLLEAALKDSIIPGAVAAIASVDGEFRVGAAGVRKTKTDVPMEPGDLMHIGSCTKAMTAVLIARLVDRGKLQWTTTIAEGLPELAPRIHADYRSVTVVDLLHHTSGMPANASNWFGFPKLGIHERRLELAVKSLQEAPEGERGTSFLYSNLGYMVAGLMAETAMDTAWEELITSEVFVPLGMTSAGFGAPGTKGETDQPWGHKVMARTALLPMQGDNAAALGPAGTVHLALRDWAKFALEFSDGSAETSTFLTPASRAKLLEVGPGDYACGWGVTGRPWARVPGKKDSKGLALWHTGSNTMWFASVWIAPEMGRAYLVAANAYGDPVDRDVDQMVFALIKSTREKGPASAGK